MATMSIIWYLSVAEMSECYTIDEQDKKSKVRGNVYGRFYWYLPLRRKER